MFKPLSNNRAALISSAGKLSLRIAPPEQDAIRSPYTRYVVVYEETGYKYPLTLFTFQLKDAAQIYYVRDLTTVATFENSSMASEDTYHFFLSWTIYEIENWAKKAGKSVVVILTKLKHCTECFATYDYRILKKETTNEYRAAKTVRR